MKIIKTKSGKEIFVSDSDFNYLNQFHWFTDGNGYAFRWTPMHNYKRKHIHMHIEIMKPPIGKKIDHWDRNKLNNQRENLRFATNSQNRSNSIVRGVSGYKGVYKHGNKWRVKVTHRGEQIYLGLHPTKEIAAAKYNEAARIFFGEFALLNDVPPII